MRTAPSIYSKRILSAFLAFSMLFQSSMTVFADETKSDEPEIVTVEESPEETIGQDEPDLQEEGPVTEETAAEEPAEEAEVFTEEVLADESETENTDQEPVPAEETITEETAAEPSAYFNDGETAGPNAISDEIKDYYDVYTYLKAMLYHGLGSTVQPIVTETIDREYPQTHITEDLMSKTSWKRIHTIWKTAGAFKDLGIIGVYEDRRALIGYAQAMLLQFLTEYSIGDEKAHEMYSDVQTKKKKLIDFIDKQIPDFSDWNGKMPSEEIRNDILLRLGAPDPSYKEMTDMAHFTLKTAGEIVDLGKTVAEGVEYALMYQNVLKLAETEKELLKDMLTVVRSHDEFKTTVWEDALKELIDGMEDERSTYTVQNGRIALDIIIKNGVPLSWSITKELVKSFKDTSLEILGEVVGCLGSFLKAASIAIGVGQKICNYLFSADEVVELYDRMAQTQNFLVLLDYLYRYERDNLPLDTSLLNCRKFTATVELFFPLYDQGNEFTKAFIEECFASKYAEYLMSNQQISEDQKQKLLKEYTDNTWDNKRLEKKLYLAVQKYIYLNYNQFYWDFFNEDPPFPVPVTGIRYERERVEYGISNAVIRGAALVPVLEPEEYDLTNDHYILTSSDENVISFSAGENQPPYSLNQHVYLNGIGEATVTATTANGKYSASVIVSVVEGDGADDEVYLDFSSVDDELYKNTTIICEHNDGWTLDRDVELGTVYINDEIHLNGHTLTILGDCFFGPNAELYLEDGILVYCGHVTIESPVLEHKTVDGVTTHQLHWDNIQSYEGYRIESPGLVKFAGSDYQIIKTGSSVYDLVEFDNPDVILDGTFNFSKLVADGEVKSTENAQISSSFDLNGKSLTVDGPLKLSGSSTFDINGGKLTVTGDVKHYHGKIKTNKGEVHIKGNYLSRDSSGSSAYAYIWMETDECRFTVDGDLETYIVNYGTQDRNNMTAGVLELNGNVNGDFTASGTHKTVFGGSGEKKLKASQLNEIELRNPEAVLDGTFNFSKLVADGEVKSTENAQISSSFDLNGKSLTVDGPLKLGGNSNTFNINKGHLIINGNLRQPYGQLNINSGEVVINGNYDSCNVDSDNEKTSGSGYIVMSHPEDRMTVTGDFYAQSSNSSTMKDGIMYFGGNVTAISRNNLYCIDNHVEVLNGTGKQTVTFQSNNKFNKLVLKEAQSNYEFNTENCWNELLSYSAAERMQISESSMTIRAGVEAQLSVTVSPEDSTDTEAYWTSSDTDVVSVDNTGKVTAVSKGTATVTAVSRSNPDLKAECVITVKDGVGIYGSSLALEGKIGLNFYLDYGTESTDDLTVVLTMNDTELRIPASKGTDRVISKHTYKMYEYPVAAKEMRDIVTLTVEDRNGNKVKLTKGSVNYTEGYSYSASDYFVRAEEAGAEKTKKLTRVLNNYGKYAQIYFNYNVTDEVKNVTDVSSVTVSTLELYQAVMDSTELSGLSYVGGSAMLDDAIGYRLYFNVESGHEIAEYTFTIDGNKVTPVLRSGAQYFIEKANIAAKDLGVMNEIKVTDGTRTKTIRYSALSYAYTALGLTEEKRIPLQNMCRAMYLYNQQAIEYFNTKN